MGSVAFMDGHATTGNLRPGGSNGGGRTSDRITLQLDGTFTEVLIMTATVGGATIGPATLSKNGTFSYTPSTRAISLLASGGARITGTVLNDTMTLNDDGDVFVFKRQP